MRYQKSLEFGPNCGECSVSAHCIGADAVRAGVTETDGSYVGFQNIQQGLNDCHGGNSYEYVSTATATALGFSGSSEVPVTTRYVTPSFQSVGKIEAMVARAFLASPLRGRVKRSVSNTLFARQAITAGRDNN